jgi:hypothetical protein
MARTRGHWQRSLMHQTRGPETAEVSGVRGMLGTLAMGASGARCQAEGAIFAKSRESLAAWQVVRSRGSSTS